MLLLMVKADFHPIRTKTYTTDLKNGMMFDIGGGSTEFVRVKNGKVKNSQSVSIGSLNLFHSNVSGLWPDKKEQKAIAKRISKRLDAVDFPKIILFIKFAFTETRQCHGYFSI